MTDKSRPVPTWDEIQKSEHFTDDERLHQLELDPSFRRDPGTRRIIGGMYGDDSALSVKFSREKVWSRIQNYMTNGEDPYVELDFITIMPPGPAGKELTKHSPVQPFDIWRFPKEYEAFKKGSAAGATGTPLSQWKAMAGDLALIRDLEYQGITTVEQLVQMADSSAPKMRSFHTWKERAKKYLEDSRKSQADVNLENKLAEQQKKHDAEIKQLTDQLNQLMKMMKKVPASQE